MNQKFRKLAFFSVAVLIAMYFSCISPGYAQTACTLNTDNEITNTSDCGIVPTTQKVTIKKILLCTSAPTAPTSSSAADVTNCPSQVYSDTSGQQVTVVLGAGAQISGVSKPANGTYTHAYVELDTTIIISANAKFASARRDFDGSSGQYCWSKAITVFSNDSINAVASNCGDAVSGQGETSWRINSFASGANTLSYTGSGGEIKVYLVTSSGILATVVTDRISDISLISGTSALNTSITIGRNTQGLKLMWGNSVGAAPNLWTSGRGFSMMTQFSVGNFDFYFVPIN